MQNILLKTKLTHSNTVFWYDMIGKLNAEKWENYAEKTLLVEEINANKITKELEITLRYKPDWHIYYTIHGGLIQNFYERIRQYFFGLRRSLPYHTRSFPLDLAR